MSNHDGTIQDTEEQAMEIVQMHITEFLIQQGYLVRDGLELRPADAYKGKTVDEILHLIASSGLKS